MPVFLNVKCIFKMKYQLNLLILIYLTTNHMQNGVQNFHIQVIQLKYVKFVTSKINFLNEFFRANCRMNEEDLFITVNIFLLFLVRDNVDELARLSLAAGAMGGMGGAKLVVLVVDPFRYPVGSLFCELEVFSFELSSLSVDRTDNNFSQDIFENFCDNPFVDINEIE